MNTSVKLDHEMLEYIQDELGDVPEADLTRARIVCAAVEVHENLRCPLDIERDQAYLTSVVEHFRPGPTVIRDNGRYRIDFAAAGLPPDPPNPGRNGTYPGQVRYWDNPAPVLSFDFVAPIWDGCRILRTADGRYFLHETGRWSAEDSFREVRSGYAERVLAQSYPEPTDHTECPATASGTIGS